MGAQLVFHDPYVNEWIVDDEPVPSVTDLGEAMRTADVTLLLQDHDAYDLETLGQAKLLFDTRGRVRDGTAEVL
jgi:UDP-N-acetyl-D-mannosaminuronate dehydrogenase